MGKIRSKWLAGALIPAVVLGLPSGGLASPTHLRMAQAELTPEELLLLQQRQQQEQPQQEGTTEPAPTETTPAEEPAPEPAPVEEPVPAEEPAPAPPPVEEPAPADEPAPEPAPVEAPAAVEEPMPVEPAVPAEEPSPDAVPAEEPAAAEEPAPADVPAPIEEPASEEKPAAAEEPAPADEPTAIEPPAAVEEPAPDATEPARDAAPAPEAPATPAPDEGVSEEPLPATEAPPAESPAEAVAPDAARGEEAVAPTEGDAVAPLTAPAETDPAAAATTVAPAEEPREDTRRNDAAAAILGAAAGAAAAALIGPTLDAPPLEGPPQLLYAPRGERRDRFEADGLQDLRRERRERRLDDTVVIDEPGGRTIIREGDRTIIIHDEVDRLSDFGRAVRRERRDGTVVTIVERPNGVEIVTVSDAEGHVLRRIRRAPDGREYVLFENRGDWRDASRRDDGRTLDEDLYVRLPPPRIRIPRDAYIVEAQDATPRRIYETFTAPPVVELDRRYTLDQVVNSPSVLDRVRRVDVDSINFASGSWTVDRSQIGSLDGLARAINTVLKENPNEVFLVEGHTDAVGPAIDNLSLSDRRAEEVAYLLTEYYGVPPENLTTKGYGESRLKVDTASASQANRRVTLRRITPLLVSNQAAQ